METPIDINDFNINRNLESFNLFITKNYTDYRKCIYCKEHIVYYDTMIAPISKKINGKSYKSKKIVNNNEYYLCVCEKCLIKKYPEYDNKNKSRVFNQMNEYTKYAYNINDDDYNAQRNLYILTTEDNLIRKYGEKIGKEKWEVYKKKQSYTNTFEYKHNKYGWTKEEYDDYNSSRSVTKENLIKRHGDDKGLKMWENYVNKQKYTKSKEYFVNKYGEEKWESLCKSKAHTLSNYIKRYGSEEIALEKIKKMHNNWNCVSKSSQKYFKEFDNYLKKIHPEIKTYYHSLNKEYMIITENRNIYYLDYFIKDWNINIEYNGDLFHANPNVFKEDDKPIPKSNITSKEIWEKDNNRLKTINDERNIKTIIIWESNLPDNKTLLEKIYEERL